MILFLEVSFLEHIFNFRSSSRVGSSRNRITNVSGGLTQAEKILISTIPNRIGKIKLLYNEVNNLKKVSTSLTEKLTDLDMCCQANQAPRES